MHLAISGNIGSGKTTLLKNYHAKFQIKSENKKYNFFIIRRIISQTGPLTPL